jgi:hypothetical protein
MKNPGSEWGLAAKQMGIGRSYLIWLTVIVNFLSAQIKNA